MSKRFIITLLTLIVIGVAATVAIFLAKGYTFSTDQKRIVGTGIITVTSLPDAASVYIDGHLTTATNATVASLVPKEYTVKVIKEGFIPWEKKVEVKEGLVTDLKITLFPSLPTLYPLTFTGVKTSTISPDGGKLAFIVPALSSTSSNKKAGVWIWTLNSDQPIAFARSAQPHQIAQTGSIDYSKATIRWSPDSKQVLASLGNNNYLLEDGSLNSEPKDITPTLQTTLKSWDDDVKVKEDARILTIKDLNIRKIASSSAIIKWSPDEKKFLYADKGQLARPAKQENENLPAGKVGLDEQNLNFKVYDLETDKQFDIPNAKLHLWLPTSRHIILVDENQISIAEYDGTNKSVVYAGKFEDSFVFAWPDSSKLVIISSYPTPTASEPNLYGINLK